MSYVRFTTEIEAARHICVAGHRNPDGDAVGACMAMRAFLAQRGRHAVVLTEPYSDKFDFLGGGVCVLSESSAIESVPCDLLVCLDCADIERLGPAKPVFSRAKTTVNIDHHGSNTSYADINIVDATAAATCEMVCDLVSDYGVLTPDIAAALYAGLVTDTGGFRHSQTSPRTHRTAAALIATGIDFTDIQRRVVYEHSQAEIRAMALAIAGMNTVPGLRFAYSGMTYADMRAGGISPVDLDGLPEYLLNTRGIETAALLSEREPGIISISLRSTKMNVGALAKRFSGGGHFHAAGGRVEGTVESAAAALIDSLHSFEHDNPPVR